MDSLIARVFGDESRRCQQEGRSYGHSSDVGPNRGTCSRKREFHGAGGRAGVSTVFILNGISPIGEKSVVGYPVSHSPSAGYDWTATCSSSLCPPLRRVSDATNPAESKRKSHFYSERSNRG